MLKPAAVSKNMTLPGWRNEMTMEHKINFSGTL